MHEVLPLNFSQQEIIQFIANIYLERKTTPYISIMVATRIKKLNDKFSLCSWLYGA